MPESDRSQGPIEVDAEMARKSAKDLELRMRVMLKHGFFLGEQAYTGQHDEVRANIMLAVRHIEDARMRLGKVIQYAGDGKSIYDRSANDPRTP